MLITFVHNVLSGDSSVLKGSSCLVCISIQDSSYKYTSFRFFMTFKHDVFISKHMKNSQMTLLGIIRKHDERFPSAYVLGFVYGGNWEHSIDSKLS